MPTEKAITILCRSCKQPLRKTPRCPTCQLPLVQGIQRTCDCPPSWATTPEQRGLWRTIGWHRDALLGLAAIDRIRCPAVAALERELRRHIRTLEDDLFGGDPQPQHTCSLTMIRRCTCGLQEALDKRAWNASHDLL